MRQGLRADAEERGLERRRTLLGWSPGGGETYTVALVTDAAEMEGAVLGDRDRNRRLRRLGLQRPRRVLDVGVDNRPQKVYAFDPETTRLGQAQADERTEYHRQAHARGE